MRVCPYCVNKLLYKQDAYQIGLSFYPGSYCPECQKLIQDGCPGFARYQRALDQQMEQLQRQSLDEPKDTEPDDHCPCC